MSQKTDHNRKKRMARKMLTREEIRNKSSIFQSAGWSKRAKQRALKQSNQGKKK